MSSNGGEANFISSKVSKKWSIFKENALVHLFSKEENLDHIDKSNTSLEDVKHVKLPLGVGILMNYWQR